MQGFCRGCCIWRHESFEGVFRDLGRRELYDQLKGTVSGISHGP